MMARLGDGRGCSCPSSSTRMQTDFSTFMCLSLGGAASAEQAKLPSDGPSANLHALGAAHIDFDSGAPRLPAFAAPDASNGASALCAGAHGPAGEGANAPVSSKSEAGALQCQSGSTNGNGGEATAVAFAADR